MDRSKNAGGARELTVPTKGSLQPFFGGLGPVERPELGGEAALALLVPPGFPLAHAGLTLAPISVDGKDNGRARNATKLLARPGANVSVTVAQAADEPLDAIP